MSTTVRAVVTAGGTAEAIDDVRVVTNLSTGRFGAALARALHARGVEVTVVGSTTMLAHDDWLPPGVARLAYRSHADLARALDAATAEAPDLLFMAAAVADYAPVPHDGKIRSTDDELVVTMQRTPKLIAHLRERCGPDTRLVGFKLLSGVTADALVDAATTQRTTHRLDAVVANDLAELTGGAHPVRIVDATGVHRIEGDRDSVADGVVAHVLGDTLPVEPPFPAADGPSVGRARAWWTIDEALGTPSIEAPSPAEGLARLREVPAHPVSVRAEARWWIGLGEVDHARLALAWPHAVAALPGPARALVEDGTVVAAWHDDGTVVHVAPTGLADAPAWAPTLGPLLPHRPWRVPHPTTWAARGFRADDTTHPDVQTPPWLRDDAAPAASAVLVHVPTRSVLVGARRTGPAPAVAFPGGRSEDGEDAEATARRELREEAGVEAPPWAPRWHVPTWMGVGPRCWRIDAVGWQVATRAHPSETPELDPRWIRWDDALRDPHVLPTVRAVIRVISRDLQRTV